ncbi:hypothetical protein Tco_0538031 [Tanacetum coccineum]
MWDLNGSPDRRTDYPDEAPVVDYDNKGKQIGQDISLSSSSSSLKIIKDNNNNNNEDDDDNDNNRLFGFSMTNNNNQPVPVTHQFFPSFNDESSSQVGPTGTRNSPTGFPTTNWFERERDDGDGERKRVVTGDGE